MIQYTEEFKIKVREVYGSQFDEMLTKNNGFLGRYLDDSSSDAISIDTILLATSLPYLQDLARKEYKKIELYKEYWNQPGVK